MKLLNLSMIKLFASGSFTIDQQFFSFKNSVVVPAEEFTEKKTDRKIES